MFYIAKRYGFCWKNGQPKNGLENQRQIYEGLSVELEEILLSEIAAKGFAKDQLFFSQREIVDRIKAFLASNLNAPKHLDGEKVLEAIAVQQGILVERAEDAYSFSHLTLQEHLTAQYIVDNPENMRSLVEKHLNNQHWREVFLLIAGLLPGSKGADPLLLLMETKARSLINTPKLKTLLQWAHNSTTGSKGNYKPAAKRAAGIFSVLDFDLDFDLARDLARNFEKIEKIKKFKSVDFANLVAELKTLRSQIPSDDQPFEVRRGFIDRIDQVWFDALGLDRETAKLYDDEAKSLEDYLYACELMVRCKEAAVRVSPQTWEAIEGRMLLPPV